MKKRYFFLFALLLPLMVTAQIIKITHGPYLCDMTHDGVTVVWTTDKPALSWVEIAPNDGQSFYMTERPKYFDTRNGRKAAYKKLHKVRIKGLESGKSYMYRTYSREVTAWTGADKVSYGNVAATEVKKSKALTFTTYDTNAVTSSFFMINDIHGKADKMKKICAGVDFSKYNFVVLNGDMATHFKTEEQVCKDFIDATVELYAKSTPTIYARGNHEARGPVADVLIDYYPTLSGEFYQLYRIGKVAYLVLDGGEDKPDSDIEYGGLALFDQYREDQAVWLKEVTESPEFRDAAVKIVFMHIPPLHSDWHGSREIGKLFLPILNKAGVDVMLSGHLHKYQYRQPNENVHFPIVVNDADSYLSCKVSDKNIEIEIVSSLDSKIKKHTFPVK